MNSVILLATVGRDPEIEFRGKPAAICHFNVVTFERRVDPKTRIVNEFAQWHQIIARGSLAEQCTRDLAKGATVYIEGALQTRVWMDQDGHEHKTTEVAARLVEVVHGDGL